MAKTYIIWLDILGFEKLAKEIAIRHEISAGKVREDFINGVNDRICSLEKRGKIERRGYRKEFDAWLLFIKNLDNVFECIQKIISIKTPFKGVKRIPVEIAVGLFKPNEEDIESYEVYEEETIEFLNSYIINEYREQYRKKHENSPKETYVLITEDVYNEIEDERSCESFIGSRKNFYKITLEKESMKNTIFPDIDKLLSRCLDEDYTILKIYRPALEDEEVNHRYNEIRSKINQILSSERNLLLQINQQDFSKQFQKLKVEPVLKPVLDVDFDKGINKCVLKHKGYELTLDKPLLLWECPCEIPAEYKNENYTCRIHSSPHGKVVGEAFGRRFTMIKYHGVKILWFDEEPLWPPAIDSIFMVKILKEKGYGERIIENILDIGCGTGFLGISLAKINPYIKEVYFSDIFLTPLLMTKLNCGLNFKGETKKAPKLFLSDNYENIPNQEIPSSGFDLIICNPPFLPTLGFERLLYKEAAVSGTRLLERVVTETKKYGNELVIGCSSMALPEFEKAVEKVGAKAEVLGNRETPFRISHAFKYKEFMDKLITERRIEERDQTPFKFWFMFYVYRILY